MTNEMTVKDSMVDTRAIKSFHVALGLGFDSSALVHSVARSTFENQSNALITQIDWDLASNAKITGGATEATVKPVNTMKSRGRRPVEKEPLRLVSGTIRLVGKDPDRDRASARDWELWTDEGDD